MDGDTRLPYRLSLVLPACNEAAGIETAVREADEALAVLVDDHEILVVDDGSRDDTAAIVARLAASLPHVRLLSHATNRGYGAALRTGFEAAAFDRVAFTDADCQFHLDDLRRLLPLTERCPVVVGYREDRQDCLRRRILSRGYNLLTRTLLGTRVRDVDCALKVFRREALEKLLPESPGFFVNTEMLTRARQQRLEVAEVGVRHRPRCLGRSKVSLADVPRVLRELLPFWWSRVLFAGRAEDRRAPQPSPWPALALLTLLAVALFLTRLRAPLLEPQEARYAEIPRQMLVENSAVVPVLHGQPYLDKPPLLYWLVMGSYRVFGVHDWAARLVPGLASVLTILVVFLWGRRVVGHRAALWGALVLCLSAGFVYRGRMLTMDGLLALWITSALAFAHVALSRRLRPDSAPLPSPPLRERGVGGEGVLLAEAQPPHPRPLSPASGEREERGQGHLWLLSAVCCALGVLTKGPVALVLVAMPILTYRFLDARCPRLSWRWGMAYVALVTALVAPWFLAVAAREPEFAGYFFWTHHVVRFVTPFDHAEPVWYYLPGLFLGLLPWTLLLPGLLRFLGRRSLRTAAHRPPALGFFLLAFLAPLVFFSASGCKRPGYILPALPALALALGVYLDVVTASLSWQSVRGLLGRRGSRLAYPAAVCSLVVAAGLVVAATATRFLPPQTAIVLVSVACVVVGLLAVVRRGVSWPVSAGVTFVILLTGVQLLLPEYNRRFSLRTHLRAHVQESDERPIILCYPQRWDSVSFYVPDAEVRHYTADERALLLRDLRQRPGAILVVKSGRLLDELLRELPESVEFVSSARDTALIVGRIQMRGDGWAER